MVNLQVKQIDIARQVGVSQSTVSLVLNGRTDASITDDVRMRIQEVALEMGYVPRGGTRKSKPTARIGLVLPQGSQATNYAELYYARFTTTAIKELGQREYQLVLPHTSVNGQLPNSFLAGIDGLLVISKWHDAWILEAAKLIPLVLVNMTLEYLPCDIVASDEVNGLYRAVKYLHDIGHRRIALFGLTDQGGAHVKPALRIRGYHSACEALHLAQGQAYVFLPECQQGGMAEIDDFAMQAIDVWKQLPTPPTGVVTLNDYCAIALLKAARLQGVSVPDQLSVVGYDDTQLCTVSDPPLTSVNQKLEEMTALACEVLMRRIARPDAPYTRVLLDVEIAERSSTTALTHSCC